MFKPRALWGIWILGLIVFMPLAPAMAGLTQNGVAIIIDADSYATNSMPISQYDTLLFSSWADNYYFGCSDYACTNSASVHQVIRIQNQSASTGTLIVRVDFLNNSTGMSTYWFKYGDPVSGAAGSRFITLSKTYDILTNNFISQQEITIVDIIGSLVNNGPAIITAMLLDSSSKILGVDAKMIFFRTDFMAWITGSD